MARTGLQVSLPRAMKMAANPRFPALVLVWGWIVRPAFAWLITRTLLQNGFRVRNLSGGMLARVLTG